MSRFWSPQVHDLTPYVPGEQPRILDLLKLNTNELPYGPSPLALQAIAAATDDTLRLYPDPTAHGLREAIARTYGVTADEVFVGNGSDEVLAHAFAAFFRQASPILFPDVTYSFYPVYCGLYGIDFQTVALDADFRIDIDSYDRPCGGIILANPNAPTGIALRLDQIEALLQRHPDCAVVIDEAYVDFGAQSAASLVARHPNLLVIHTLSKSRALAGLRVGYALGHPDLIEGLTRIKDSFNSYPLDRLAQAGATAAINDTQWLAHTTQQVMTTRDALARRMAAMGFTVLPSAANFVFVHHPDRNAQSLARALREDAILVRHLNGARTQDWLRISIGTDAQTERLIDSLLRILGRNDETLP